jgi:AraC-like DNA-binding protein
MLVLSALPLAAGPLHYLYARHLVDPARRVRPKDLLHAIPYTVYLLLMAPLFILPSEAILNELFRDSVAGFPRRFVIMNWLLVVQAMLYLGATLLLLRRYQEALCDMFSNTDRIRLDWLRSITLIVLAGWISFLVENILLATDMHTQEYFGFSGLLGAVFVYVMGYLGFAGAGIFSDPEVDTPLRELASRSEERSGVPDAAPRRYGKSGLSEERANDIMRQLLELMDSEHPYRDSGITLPRLAELLGVSAHNLSEVINTLSGMNFFDFVNSYRVKQVQRDLLDAEKQQYKVLSLAFDAGFNSKTSFNSIFRKHTGMTPTEWRTSRLDAK